MSTAFEIEFPGVERLGARVPSWHAEEDFGADIQYWGEPDSEDIGMEAIVCDRSDGTFWVESWHGDVGLVTFWTAPDLPTAIRLADYIVRGGL